MAANNVAYVPSTADGPEPAPAKPSALARTTALTKSLVVGKLAPSKLFKAGALTLDGVRRWVELRGGVLTISTTKGGELLFRAPMKFVQVVADAATRETARRHRGKIAPNEIALYVEPELMNREVDAQSSRFGFGWFPGHLRPGYTPPEASLAGDVKRQNFSLFADNAADKQSWRITLNTAAKSLRDWAYVKHEITDSFAYLSGKKR
ncbi:hypothetical protein CTAYLR_006007 [Chrysophaeum taylorii]|uniref:Uncharacterized protein n=1 Tax=Chrysophaeum taylorii TaxID=2483200 RepID=A0AAD7U6Q8_9STRA|nr:hypothetical protein CTAYLR_006007 [Chrysophaeum taylorii]